MTAKRHSVTPGPANKVADDDLLDAARDCVLDAGVRRTTLADVARRAEVSRMTLYRRYPDVRSLLAALMTREFGALLSANAERTADAPTARERLVSGAEGAVRALVADPLMRTVLDRDPQMMLPYLFERIGSVQRFAEQYLSGQLAAGHADGSIREGDRPAQARALFLVVQAFVFAYRPATTDLDDDRLFAQLRHLLDAALLPDPS